MLRSPCPRLLCRIASIAACALVTTNLRAEPPESVEFFENRIRPVLVEHCYQCHSSGAEKIGGSLLLDSSADMLTGGDSGPAIEPGNVDDSMLISALRYESSEMPPGGKLPERVVRDFEQWVAAGAVDPRTAARSAGSQRSDVDLEAGRQFWAFQPIVPAAVPQLGGAAAGVWIDAFIDEPLLAAGVTANEPADPATLLRRLAFDLTGLPPDPPLQSRWLADPSRRHWLRIVDDLLASPQYAEHWARHWMDVARYADSNGSDFNATFHEAWRYRDYLIRSFAADRPLDQMIRQQIAGDLLQAESDQQRYDNVVATTFLMIGTKMLSERDKAKLTLDVVDEQIDSIGRAFLGLTLGCARCHDHKFDPVRTADYYALAGIFKSIVTLNGESQKYVSTWNRVPLPASSEHRAAVARHEATRKQLEAEITAAEKALQAAQQHAKKEQDAGTTDSGQDADAAPTPDPVAEAQQRLNALQAERQQLQANAPPALPEAMAPAERPGDEIDDSAVHIRGEVNNLGPIVPRGFLPVCSADAAIPHPQGSGRIELADWLTSPDNPLVARVLVNRVWLHLMGQGLVRTPDNFGMQGDRPTHPELLDALASELIHGGWQIKPMIRRIVASQAYRRSSAHNTEAVGIDPENRLWWRMPRRRLPAEAIRDAMIVAAGTLDQRPRIDPMKGYGTLVSKNDSDSAASFDDVSQPCRSIYLPVVRGYLPPMMTALDAADPDLLVGQRPTTNVPGQALLLINSPEVNAWALSTAERIVGQPGGLHERLEFALRLCLQRSAGPLDREIAEPYFAGREDSLDTWQQYVAALFASTEFRLLD
jgi:hypothetical protein